MANFLMLCVNLAADGPFQLGPHHSDVSVNVIANKWVPLISIVLFILSDAKQRENH